MANQLRTLLVPLFFLALAAGSMHLYIPSGIAYRTLCLSLLICLPIRQYGSQCNFRYRFHRKRFIAFVATQVLSSYRPNSSGYSKSERERLIALALLQDCNLNTATRHSHRCQVSQVPNCIKAIDGQKQIEFADCLICFSARNTSHHVTREFCFFPFL